MLGHYYYEYNVINNDYSRDHGSGGWRMKKVIVFASLLILASTHIISASEGDQLPQSTMEGQTISSQLSSPATDISDTLLPAPSDTQANDITKPQEDLSHEGLTSAPQSKGFLQSLNIFNLFRANKATQPIQPSITKSELAALKEPGTTSLPDIDRKDNKAKRPKPFQMSLPIKSFPLTFKELRLCGLPPLPELMGGKSISRAHPRLTLMIFLINL